MQSRAPSSAGEQPAPAKWVDWQPTMKVESPPPAEERPPRRPRRRFRPKRRPVPWAFLIVGLLVGLASIGLVIVLIIALWPSGKGEALQSTAEKLVNRKDTPTGWQEVVSDEGRFRVLMPGTPTISDSVQRTSLGSLPIKTYDAFEGPDCKFSVWYGDLDSDEVRDVSPNDWLDAVRDACMIESQGNWQSEMGANDPRIWSRQIRYGTPDTHKVMLCMYVENRRVYTLRISRKKDYPPGEVFMRFFDSFQTKSGFPIGRG